MRKFQKKRCSFLGYSGGDVKCQISFDIQEHSCVLNYWRLMMATFRKWVWAKKISLLTGDEIVWGGLVTPTNHCFFLKKNPTSRDEQQDEANKSRKRCWNPSGALTAKCKHWETFIHHLPLPLHFRMPLHSSKTDQTKAKKYTHLSTSETHVEKTRNIWYVDSRKPWCETRWWVGGFWEWWVWLGQGRWPHQALSFV